jgi:hypothetical protein
MPKNNAASRLLWVLTGARSNTKPQQMHMAAGDVWPMVFGMGGLTGHSMDMETVRLLDLSLAQAAIVRRHFVERGEDASWYRDKMQKIEAGLAIRNIGNQWQPSVLTQFDDKTVTMLETAAPFIPETEAWLSESQLGELNEVVSDFRSSLVGVNLPPVVMDFLHRQLLLMEGALRGYPIAGAQVFLDSSDAAATDWATHSVALAPYRANVAVVKAGDTWSKILKFAKGVVILGTAMHTLFGGATMTVRLMDGYHMLSPAAEHALQPFLTQGVSTKQLPSGQAQHDDGSSVDESRET